LAQGRSAGIDEHVKDRTADVHVSGGAHVGISSS